MTGPQNPEDIGLRPGYRHLRRGSAQYAAVLRDKAARKIVWACADSHVTTVQALWCANGELARRTQAGREVFTLRWCAPCGRWWTPSQAASGLCPRCDVPLEAVKLVVLERRPVC